MKPLSNSFRTSRCTNGDVHLDVVGAVVVAAVGVERAPGGPLGGVGRSGVNHVNQVKYKLNRINNSILIMSLSNRPLVLYKEAK